MSDSNIFTVSSLGKLLYDNQTVQYNNENMYVSCMDFELPLVDDATFIVHLLPVKYLLTLSAIPRHENIKDHLISMPLQEMARSEISHQSIFVSHRWVNGQPDSPIHDQFKHIINTVQMFEHHEYLYIWIDYACMKQDEPDLPT
eukprot:gene13131-17598_t